MPMHSQTYVYGADALTNICIRCRCTHKHMYTVPMHSQTYVYGANALTNICIRCQCTHKHMHTVPMHSQTLHKRPSDFNSVCECIGTAYTYLNSRKEAFNPIINFVDDNAANKHIQFGFNYLRYVQCFLRMIEKRYFIYVLTQIEIPTNFLWWLLVAIDTPQLQIEN
jgi:hypothetical protein